MLFILRLFDEYSDLEYVHIHVIYRAKQVEYGIRILVAASQDYLNTYLTRRPTTPTTPPVQLIVITHDEKFVKSLGASGYCNHYYRVSKQMTGGEVHSSIEQVAISQFD